MMKIATNFFSLIMKFLSWSVRKLLKQYLHIKQSATELTVLWNHVRVCFLNNPTAWLQRNNKLHETIKSKYADNLYVAILLLLIHNTVKHFFSFFNMINPFIAQG